MSAAKTIILCCDGTSNEFGRVNTNVVRLFQSLDLTPASGQVAYYDPGVGTLAAPGFSCRSQLHGLAGINALHPIQILAEQALCVFSE